MNMTVRLARFETAADIIRLLIASCSDLICQERSKKFPGVMLIEKLKKEQQGYFEIDLNLTIDDSAWVDRIISRYGPAVRESYKVTAYNNYRHRVADDMNGRIYEEYRDRCLKVSVSQDYPVAVITGGQPGSGKSGLMSLAKSRLYEHGGFVYAEIKTLRAHHPDYRRFFLESRFEAESATASDVVLWMNNLIRHASSDCRNLIINHASRDPDLLTAIALELRRLGYMVELHVAAVNAEVSEQRVILKQEIQEVYTGISERHGRDEYVRDYISILETVGMVEAAKSVNAIFIYDKEFNCLYSNKLLYGEWENHQMAKVVMETERNREMTLAEKKEYAENCGIIMQMINDRSSDMQEKKSVRAHYMRVMESFERAEAVERAIELFGSDVFIAEIQDKSVCSGKCVAETSGYEILVSDNNTAILIRKDKL